MDKEANKYRNKLLEELLDAKNCSHILKSIKSKNGQAQSKLKLNWTGWL